MTSHASAPDEQDRTLRWRRFLRLWVGNTATELGSAVTFVAMPLLAVVTLGASPLQVGILNALEYAPYLGMSLLVGVWVDRHSRRATMIASDLARAALIALIIVLAAASLLNIWLLFAIAGLLGVFGVVFVTAGQAYLQQLVGRDQTTRATAWAGSAAFVARSGGRALAGILVEVWNAATALIVDAVSFVISAAAIASIPASAVPQPPPKPIPKGGFVRHVKNDIAEGFDFIRGSSFLRGMLRFMIHSNFLLAARTTLIVPFLLLEVGVGAGTVGLLLALSIVGAVIGTSLTPMLVRRFRAGLVFGLAATIGPLSIVLLPLTTDGIGLVWFAVGLFVADFATAIFNILAVGYRYQIVPEDLMGRVAVSMRTFFLGVIPIGALVGGALGEFVGLRPAMWIVAIGMVFLPLWMVRTPAWKLTRQDVGVK